MDIDKLLGQAEKEASITHALDDLTAKYGFTREQAMVAIRFALLMKFRTLERLINTATNDPVDMLAQIVTQMQQVAEFKIIIEKNPDL